MANKKHKRLKTGWVRTNNIHAGHPAKYVSKGKKEVEYITFTHSDEVEFTDRKVKTIPLKDNISPAERKQNKGLPKSKQKHSYAFPVVYTGTKDSLGKKTKEFNPIEEDKRKIKELFGVLPRVKVKPKTKKEHKKKKLPRA